MKRALLVLCILAACKVTYAQLYGAQWDLGPNTTRIDFRNDTVVNDSIRLWMGSHLTNAAICDNLGSLLFYTNGIYVANGTTGDSILNGNGLSPCELTSQDGAQGLPFIQGALFLPKPGNDRYIYLFHFSGDSNTNPATLYYSVIDREGNNGQGEIIDKNVKYYGNTIFWAGGMTACKHANGRDWWIIMHGKNNNRFFKFLFTPDGIQDTLIQDIGATYVGPYDNSSACFSPDGSKYACGAFVGLITVMDFDRCTGEFSNAFTINNVDGQTESGEGPMAFSPNGRFLYVSGRVDLTQFDLWSNNGQDSIIVYEADSTDNAQINFVSLSVNGKIYGSTWNGGFEYLHVINYPDSLGHSCGFVRGGQPTLSVNSANLPNMPNYMLGALAGSSCDTITSIKDIPLSYQLRCQPNPADKFLYVEMNTQSNYLFELVDMNGKAVAVKDTRQVDVFDTENLSNGVYLLNVIDKRNDSKLLSKEIVVQH